MNITKECQDSTFQPKSRPAETTTYCTLRADKGDMSLKTLTALFNEAQKDFPGLKPEDVTISRSQPLTGMEKLMAASAGPVSIDSIGFVALANPPASYRRLKPTGYAQG